MATKFAKPLEASQTTHVADMPPLDVVTEGIPVQEHIGPPPVAPPEAPPGAPERRKDRFVDDAAEADRTFDMLMGDAVDPRRRFIQTHAKAVRNLDI